MGQNGSIGERRPAVGTVRGKRALRIAPGQFEIGSDVCTALDFDLQTGDISREMETSTEIRCPFCGQEFELLIDTTQAEQQFTTDCEVCCRPFTVTAECEPGEVLNVQVTEN